MNIIWEPMGGSCQETKTPQHLRRSPSAKYVIHSNLGAIGWPSEEKHLVGNTFLQRELFDPP